MVHHLLEDSRILSYASIVHDHFCESSHYMRHPKPSIIIDIPILCSTTSSLLLPTPTISQIINATTTITNNQQPGIPRHEYRTRSLNNKSLAQLQEMHQESNQNPVQTQKMHQENEEMVDMWGGGWRCCRCDAGQNTMMRECQCYHRRCNNCAPW